jgi:hypothetical protein
MFAHNLVMGQSVTWNEGVRAYVPDHPEWVSMHYTWMLPWLDLLQKHLLALGVWDRSCCFADCVSVAWLVSRRINVCAGWFECSVSFAWVICARSAEHNVIAIAILFIRLTPAHTRFKPM